METSDKTLLHSVIRIMDTLTNDTTHYDTLISVLSLLCILSIVNRTQNKAITMPTSNTNDNPIQKIIGQLTKGDDTNAPDMLMSLLPLLNNPQVKSKLNPANISSILGLINTLGVGSNDKISPKQDKSEKLTKSESSPTPAPITQVVTQQVPAPLLPNTDIPEAATADQGDTEKRNVTRSLNWKSNF
jgi:hypothetical protein